MGGRVCERETAVRVPGLGRDVKRLRRRSKQREGGRLRWQLAGGLEQKVRLVNIPCVGTAILNLQV